MTVFRACIGLLVLGAAVSLPDRAVGYSSGAPSGFAGDIERDNGVAQTCTTCHSSFDLNSGTGSVAIDAPDSVAPGETIDITVTVDNTTDPVGGGRRQGFSAIVKDPAVGDNGTFVGSYTIPDPGSVQTTENNDTYLTHAGDISGRTSWTFRWTAPSANVPSEVVIYAAGNAANGQSSGGDYIYTDTHTVTFASVAAETGPRTDIGVRWGAVAPNPLGALGRAEIELADPAVVAIRLVDGRGRVVRALASGPRAAGRTIVDLDVRALAPGTYFLVAETAQGRRTQAVQVVR